MGKHCQLKFSFQEKSPVSCTLALGRSPLDTCAPKPGLLEVPTADVRALLLTSY